jgi:hypothetical protein
VNDDNYLFMEQHNPEVAEMMRTANQSTSLFSYLPLLAQTMLSPYYAHPNCHYNLFDSVGTPLWYHKYYIILYYYYYYYYYYYLLYSPMSL